MRARARRTRCVRLYRVQMGWCCGGGVSVDQIASLREFQTFRTDTMVELMGTASQHIFIWFSIRCPSTAQQRARTHDQFDRTADVRAAAAASRLGLARVFAGVGA